MAMCWYMETGPQHLMRTDCHIPLRSVVHAVEAHNHLAATADQETCADAWPVEVRKVKDLLVMLHSDMASTASAPGPASAAVTSSRTC